MTITATAAQMAKVAGAAYVAVIDPIEKRRHAALDAGATEVGQAFASSLVSVRSGARNRRSTKGRHSATTSRECGV